MAPRTILHIGTGGAGATCVAAATARRLAAAGTETLLLSLDPGQDLGDLLGERLVTRARAVGERLEAAQVVAQDELERRGGAVQGWLGDALVRRGIDRITAAELVAAPGMDELFGLVELERHHRAGRHDAIVVDCGARGPALRMLALPDLARFWLEKALPQRSAMTAAARPLAQLDLRLPGGAGAAQRLVRELIAVSELLRDRERTSVRLVATADPPAVLAAERVATGLALYDLPVDAVVVNRVLPGDASGTLAARAAREGALAEWIAQAFAPIPVLRAPLLDDDVAGPDALDRLGDAVFAEADPADVLHTGAAHDLEMGAHGATLRLDLPFARREELDVKQVGLDLVVRVGPHKRVIALPPALADYGPLGAAFDDGALHVSFTRTPATADD
ncbi:MAG TPA: ArsA family ATPase [Solirubrobacteraceae bacterium]|nr:ArsA family ATPase [Solirubrobacteraceae bacterium]